MSKSMYEKYKNTPGTYAIALATTRGGGNMGNGVSCTIANTKAQAKQINYNAWMSENPYTQVLDQAIMRVQVPNLPEFDAMFDLIVDHFNRLVNQETITGQDLHDVFNDLKALRQAFRDNIDC